MTERKQIRGKCNRRAEQDGERMLTVNGEKAEEEYLSRRQRRGRPTIQCGDQPSRWSISLLPRPRPPPIQPARGRRCGRANRSLPAGAPPWIPAPPDRGRSSQQEWRACFGGWPVAWFQGLDSVIERGLDYGRREC
jgi:hypothetical protein